MPLKLSKILKQKAVYWRRTGSGGSGQPTYATPVELAVRWSDMQEEILTSDSRRVIANGNVMIASPATVGSLLFLGTLDDWRALPNYPRVPTMAQGGREVFRAGHIPDRRGRNYLYRAWF